jgi:transposase
LIRELNYLEEIAPKVGWAKKMRELFQESIHKRKTGEIKPSEKQKIVERFEKLIYQCTDKLYEVIQNLQKSLRKHRDHVFRFLEDPYLPHDNNATERTFRNVKVKQKVSGGFRSDTGAAVYALIHSIADTARKNKQPPLLAFRTISY